MSTAQDRGEPGLKYPTDIPSEVPTAVHKFAKMVVDNLYFIRRRIEELASSLAENASSRQQSMASSSSSPQSETVTLTGQSAIVGSTNFQGESSPGLYRLSYYLETTTGAGGAGTIQLSVSFTDAAGATTVVSTAVSLAAIGRTSGVVAVQLQSGSIAYSTILTGIFGASKYALYLCLERLS